MSRNFIEADGNAMEKNLRFVQNEMENNLNQFFGSSGSGGGGSGSHVQAPPRDYKVATPTPGFCLKSFKVNTNEKYFINVCQTDSIPPPEDLSEEQLSEILDSETPSAFRIPMSISQPRITKDKSDNPVDVCDIAINPQFFQKINKSFIFKNFFIALVAEAISDKYNVQLNMDKAIILNNRKFIGTLVTHRIRNTDVKTVLQSYTNPTQEDLENLKKIQNDKLSAAGRGGSGGGVPLIQEIDENDLKKLNLPKHSYLKEVLEPIYKLRVRIRGDLKKELQAEFYLPKCITVKDFNLDVGEDRLILESEKCNYSFDKFVDYTLNNEGARAIFDKTTKMLQVRVPIIAE